MLHWNNAYKSFHNNSFRVLFIITDTNVEATIRHPALDVHSVLKSKLQRKQKYLLLRYTCCLVGTILHQALFRAQLIPVLLSSTANYVLSSHCKSSVCRVNWNKNINNDITLKTISDTGIRFCKLLFVTPSWKKNKKMLVFSSKMRFVIF